MSDLADASPVQEPVPEAPPTVNPEALAGDIEAMLLASGSTVPAMRLAVALGLVAPAAEDAVPDNAAAVEQPAPAPKAGRRRGQSSKSSAENPETIVASAVELLNQQYEKSDRSFRIERVAGGYRFMTLARHARAVAALRQHRDSTKLSRPAIETLAIIAYRQPITRAELEAIRGVACGEVLKSLMERRLIAIVGRSEELGRPMLYGTTRHFLDAFGLAALKDLPSAQDLKTAL